MADTGLARSLGTFGGVLVSGMAGAIAGATARSLIIGTDFGDNIVRVLPNVIGNTVGNLIADAVTEDGKPTPELVRGGTGGAFGLMGAAALAELPPPPEIAGIIGATPVAAEGDGAVLTVTGKKMNWFEKALFDVGDFFGLRDDTPRAITTQQRELGNRFFATYSAAYARQDKAALVASYARDARRANAIQAQVNRETWNLVNTGIQPLQPLTSAYRWTANSEHNWENGLAVGSALLGPALKYGAPLGRTAVPEGIAFLHSLRLTAPVLENSTARLIGSYVPSAELKYGTTLFGDEAHTVAGRMLTEELSVRGVPIGSITNRTGSGLRGVDLSVSEEFAGKLGFEHIEIKPNTASGLKTFSRQVSRWSHDPSTVKAVTYDAHGNIWWGFDF